MNARKPQADAETPHMEKQVLPEPTEEFMSDQSVPSTSMQSVRAGVSTSPDSMFDLKPAGHQSDKPECFEPGVEG
jgi:hypothetical protein